MFTQEILIGYSWVPKANIPWLMEFWQGSTFSFSPPLVYLFISLKKRKEARVWTSSTQEIPIRYSWVPNTNILWLMECWQGLTFSSFPPLVSFFLFLKKEEGKGMDIVHPGDSNKIHLGPKRRHSMVDGMLAGSIFSFFPPLVYLFISL